MKYFFHLILILLFAFIVAGLYEIFIVRDGKVNLSDIYEETIQDSGGWDKVLSGDGSLSKLSFLDRFSNRSKDSQKNEIVDSEDVLAAVYQKGELSDDQMQGLGLSLSDRRYHVLEYCTPGVDLCKDSYINKMESFFTSQIETVTYSVRPYLPNFGDLNEDIWAGYYCLEPEVRNEYLSAIYETRKLTQDTFSLLVKKLKIDDLDVCIQDSNVRLFLTRQMRQAKDIFSIASLPTYIVLDTEESRWISIPGLYPQEEVETVLENEFPIIGK